ncbi:hypothetical protein H6F93_02690 [Leptolyngbya sp. FACHB-671]|uniref:hypothetical protein n=1 Tax=Leptolyngbya sp. FACHB-671 TaxID=2692812 RepID=UPI0016865DFF|nr:hypothetical protein [Leptolyngbya sp. FACHB-671]MBD2066443.1 hypothetical protein [Leptolyngbya sp. FACHB-671]
MNRLTCPRLQSIRTLLPTHFRRGLADEDDEQGQNRRKETPNRNKDLMQKPVRGDRR